MLKYFTMLSLNLGRFNFKLYFDLWENSQIVQMAIVWKLRFAHLANSKCFVYIFGHIYYKRVASKARFVSHMLSWTHCCCLLLDHPSKRLGVSLVRALGEGGRKGKQHQSFPIMHSAGHGKRNSLCIGACENHQVASLFFPSESDAVVLLVQVFTSGPHHFQLEFSHLLNV